MKLMTIYVISFLDGRLVLLCGKSKQRVKNGLKFGYGIYVNFTICDEIE